MKMITETEFDDILAKALAVADEPVQELHIEIQDIDLTALEPYPTLTTSTASTPSSRASQMITIRIPSWVIAAFRAQAIKTKVPYQRLMNKALASAARAFV